jgi:hypothetical protein
VYKDVYEFLSLFPLAPILASIYLFIHSFISFFPPLSLPSFFFFLTIPRFELTALSLLGKPCCFLEDSDSDCSEVEAHCCFDFYFLMDKDDKHFFMCLLAFLKTV